MSTYRGALATRYPRPPQDRPEGAVGFVVRRWDRPERFALYSPDGALASSLGAGEDPQSYTRDGLHRLVPAQGRRETWWLLLADPV